MQKRILTHAARLVLALLMSLPLGALCSNEMVQGVYALQGGGTNMLTDPPSPASVAGTFEADGAGRITAWSDWLTTAGTEGPAKRVVRNDLVAAAASLGNQVTYTVNADCTMSIDTTIEGPRGPLPIHLQGGLAEGGRRLLLQFGAPVFIGPWTAIRSEEDDRLTSLGDLLRRVALRLSVVPRR